MDEVTYLSVQIDLLIELQNALHIGTGFGAGRRLDDTIVRGPHPLIGKASSLPYIPGSSLKGRLRHHVRELAETLGWASQPARAGVEGELFGYTDQPGRLRFADAHLADLGLARKLSGSDSQPATLPAWVARNERSFVGLSRRRRVAEPQRLFRIELAEPGLIFRGQVNGSLAEKVAGEARRSLALLVAATRVLTHLGGHKGRGLGACTVTIPEDGLRLNDETLHWQSLLEVLG